MYSGTYSIGYCAAAPGLGTAVAEHWLPKFAVLYMLFLCTAVLVPEQLLFAARSGEFVCIGQPSALRKAHYRVAYYIQTPPAAEALLLVQNEKTRTIGRPAAMPFKKLFIVGWPTVDSLINDTDIAQAHWQQLLSCFEPVLLASPKETVDVDFSSVQANERLQPAAAAIVSPGEHQLLVIEQLRAVSQTLFIICWHPKATEDAKMRVQAFQRGANMVTYCSHAINTALQQIGQQQSELPRQQHVLQQQASAGNMQETGLEPHTTNPSSAQLQQQQQHKRPRLHPAGDMVPANVSSNSTSSNSSTQCVSCSCDWCGLPGLSAAEYWLHQQLYHINHPNKAGRCQICGRPSQNLARHLHDHHEPNGKPPEHRTGVFALAILRRPSDGKFLMTQEFAGSGYWVPGGGVDPGETLTQGAIRECWEEAGVQVDLKGILTFECQADRQWRRVIFWGEPTPALTGTSAALAPQTTQPLSSVAAQASAAQLGHTSLQKEAKSSLPVGSSTCCSPKTLPNWESTGACWVDVSELRHLPLRSPSEPCKWFPVVAAGTEKLSRGLDLPAEWVGVFEGFASV